MVKKRKQYSVIMGLCLLIGLSGCSMKGDGMTVKDIAYKKGEKVNEIYIKEGEKYVPFLVLQEGYNRGKTLLLRRDILEESHRMNEYSSFYEDSEMDKFLNTDYLSLLEDSRDAVEEAELVITDKNSIGRSGSETKQIKRKVFLLSLEETGYESYINAAKEGEIIKFFKKTENRQGLQKGSPTSWALRTPNTYFVSGCYGIGGDGTLDVTNAYDEMGVRPAFLVDSKVEIEKKGEIVYGEEVYVFKTKE